MCGVTPVDDLAAWLTQIWDEQEKAARFALELTERAYPADEFVVSWRWARISEHKLSGGGGHSFERGSPSPTEVLARIAADRQILAWCTERHRIYVGTVGDDPSDPKNYVPGDFVHGSDSVVVRLLAQPYADRPGYQEAWKP